MSKGIQSFTNKELERLLKKAKEFGAPSVDVISNSRDTFYRINLTKKDQKEPDYDWFSDYKENDLVI